MKLNFLLELITTASLGAIAWLHQFAIYPFFAQLPEEVFNPSYAKYWKGLKKILYPLILLQLVFFILMIFFRNYLWPEEWILTAFIILVNLFIIFFLNHPIHKRLAQNKHAELIGELKGLNLLSAVLWTAILALLLNFYAGDI